MDAFSIKIHQNYCDLVLGHMQILRSKQYIFAWFWSKSNFLAWNFTSVKRIFGSIRDHFWPATRRLKSYRSKKIEVFYFLTVYHFKYAPKNLFQLGEVGSSQNSWVVLHRSAVDLHYLLKVENVALFYGKISESSVLKLFFKLAALFCKTTKLFRPKSMFLNWNKFLSM